MSAHMSVYAVRGSTDTPLSKGMYNASVSPRLYDDILQKSPRFGLSTGPASPRQTTGMSRSPRRSRRSGAALYDTVSPQRRRLGSGTLAGVFERAIHPRDAPSGAANRAPPRHGAGKLTVVAAAANRGEGEIGIRPRSSTGKPHLHRGWRAHRPGEVAGATAGAPSAGEEHSGRCGGDRGRA
jgi:hypothetical protein